MSLYFTKNENVYLDFQWKDASGTQILEVAQAVDYYLYSPESGIENALLHKTLSDMTFDQNGVYHITITPSDISSITSGRYISSVIVTYRSEQYLIFSDTTIIENTNLRNLKVKALPAVIGAGEAIYINGTGGSPADIPTGYTIDDIGVDLKTGTLEAEKVSVIVIDVSNLGMGLDTVWLMFHDYDPNTSKIRFSGYSIGTNTYAIAELTYDDTDNTLALTGADMGGTDISGYISSMTWCVSTIGS